MVCGTHRTVVGHACASNSMSTELANEGHAAGGGWLRNAPAGSAPLKDRPLRGDSLPIMSPRAPTALRRPRISVTSGSLPAVHARTVTGAVDGRRARTRQGPRLRTSTHCVPASIVTSIINGVGLAGRILKRGPVGVPWPAIDGWARRIRHRPAVVRARDPMPCSAARPSACKRSQQASAAVTRAADQHVAVVSTVGGAAFAMQDETHRSSAGKGSGCSVA